MSFLMPMRAVNRLIEGLPGKQRERALQCSEAVELLTGAILCEPGQTVRYVYFPLTGFIALVTTLAGHPPLAMGLIGSEGMLGVTLALGLGAAPMRALVLSPGTALRMSAAQLRQQMRDNPALLRTLNHYLYMLMGQMSQNAACTHFHAIEPRLARCLLMMLDRTQAGHFHLTHKILADMLGVRRSGVTIAAGALQHRRLIHYSRGEIRILDRRGLEVAACPCYDPGAWPDGGNHNQ
ncbi:Crp/Fnr family transcriptional regulator [Pseudomonas sp. sp1636]|uniref:Crp/Fnr family transcriptional regulator n=1 Tax=Pseudomonas sp. sp1636 TaxID=3036707 RepID=UPI0025A65683|nr:Crp/Fnr family transcriptional regulator [Pseudomonas sp. sp1636]MDM8349704.1 Crp/Fnr family transcriptional regulator [Pseudomonas sp. sp1636]